LIFFMDNIDPRPAKILIVDNDPIVYYFFEETLKKEGYVTEYASSGQIALEKVSSKDIDLILLDIMMPEIDGFEVCKRLQENPLTKSIPIIFVSAVDDKQSYIKGFELGAIDYLNKPINQLDLVIKIRNYLKLTRNEAELKKSELRYKSIVEDQTEFIFRCLPDGTISFINPAFCNFLNKDNNELVGMNISFLVYPNSSKDILEELRLLTPDDTVQTHLRTISFQDGRLAWQQWVDRAIFDPGGRLTEYQSVGRDITIQKNYEEAIKAITDKTAGVTGTSFFNVLLLELLKIIRTDFTILGTFSDDERSEIKTFAACHKGKIIENFKFNVKKSLFENHGTKKDLINQDCFSAINIKGFSAFGKPMQFIAGIPLFNKDHSIIGVLAVFGKDNFEMTDITFDIIKMFSIRAAAELERDLADQKLKESEKKFKNIFQSSIDSIVISDMNFQILELNNAFQNTFSLLDNDQEQIKLTDIVLKSEEEKLTQWLSDLKLSKQNNPLDIKGLNANGQTITMEINSIVIDYEGKNAILSILRDITERKEVHQRILNTIIETEEKERQRYAQDLHDGMGPLLSTIKLYTRSILTAKNEKNKAIALEKSLETIDEAISSIKEIAYNISPHILKDFGLKSAVKSYINKFNDAKKFTINFQSDIETRFDSNIEASMFRIIIELVNNTYKHAFANNIIIALTFADDVLKLNYTDNGIGFDLNRTMENRTGRGIFNITNRVKSLDGDIAFETAPDKGFCVKINMRVPKYLTNP
jgi:PAS domain S-box-containing protein